MTWGRTNQLMARAAKALGVGMEPVVDTPTDFFARLVDGDRRVIVSKTRSPFLTQVAQSLANNKHVSRRLLSNHGVPVIEDLLLDDDAGPEDRRVAPWLARHGEVAVKPNSGNRGSGITPHVSTLETLERAYRRARGLDLDEEVVVEPWVAGINVRVAVIGGAAVAAAEVRRPRLSGDGRRSALNWVAELNRDARRGRWQNRDVSSMDVIEPGEDFADYLGIYGLDPDSPVPDGLCIELCGEEQEVIDVTDDIHPSWCSVAERACGLLGVDVGGVDFRGPREAFLVEAPASAVLLEVNVLPALHLHALPTQGRPRKVFEAFVAYCLSMPGAPLPAANVQV